MSGRRPAGEAAFPGRTFVVSLAGKGLETMRIGIGYDIHRLEEGRPLILGGVRVVHSHGLLGHSDADVLIHAVIDALLGAAGLGDIGEHFSDRDPAYAGADSAELLARVVAKVAAAGFRIGNVDTIIHAEQPKLSPHKSAIRERLAGILGIDPARVNVKAKTAEGLGPLGEGLAIAAWAVAILIEPAEAFPGRQS